MKERLNPSAIYLMELLNIEGYESRICGGAVRDLLFGETPRDWDIATVACPEIATQILENRGIHVIPTGLQHGTITAMLDGKPYEITTLRVDAVTDGRHAEVEFTDDWKTDAERRDFTYNAMYLDSDGVLYDFFNGQEHLSQRRTCFVGNPVDRIREDYLRILRFFRFATRMQFMVVTDAISWTWDDNPVNGRVGPMMKDVINSHVGGLDNVSGERIWDELNKIHNIGHGYYNAFGGMCESGVLSQIGLDGMTSRMYNLIRHRHMDDRFSVILASCFHEDSVGEFIDVLKNRFKASTAEIKPIEVAHKYKSVERSMANARRLYAQNVSRDDIAAWISIGYNATDKVKETLAADFKNANLQTMWASPPPRSAGTYKELYNEWNDKEIPEFPIRGQDIIDMGVPNGPRIGQLMKDLKMFWADTNFEVKREALLNKVTSSMKE